MAKTTEMPHVATADEVPSQLPAHVRRDTYGEILKSTALIGGSTLLGVAISIVRTKAMAVLLGPPGIGLISLYGSITDLARSIAGLGIGSSGVRQIADAAGSGDSMRIGRTATVLRRTAVVLGLLGAAALVALSRQVSALTFGNTWHSAPIALLSACVFLSLIAEGQGALLQGTRRIRELAKTGLVGAVLGTVTSIPLVYLFGEQGVVPALIAIAAASMLSAWWYGRKVKIERPAMSTVELKDEAAALLKLGVAFMASGLLMMGAAYVTRLIVLREVGMNAAGLYQAAWTIGGFYVGFILQAMGTDFYPRLVAVSSDNAECNRLVNEQAHVSLLLAGPGVLATLVLAPLIVSLFYSSRFGGAVEVLRWICLGIALRVISWPMGFIIVARNNRAFFFGTELAWTAFNVGATWFLVDRLGLAGAGVAFFASYVFHIGMIYPIVRRLSGFRWSAPNRRAALLFISLIGGVSYALRALPQTMGILIGAVAMLVSGVYSIRALITLVPMHRVSRRVQQCLELLRLARSKTPREGTGP